MSLVQVQMLVGMYSFGLQDIGGFKRASRAHSQQIQFSCVFSLSLRLRLR